MREVWEVCARGSVVRGSQGLHTCAVAAMQLDARSAGMVEVVHAGRNVRQPTPPAHSPLQALQDRVGEGEGALCVVLILDVHLKINSRISKKRVNRLPSQYSTNRTVKSQAAACCAAQPAGRNNSKLTSTRPGVHQDLDGHKRLPPFGQVHLQGVGVVEMWAGKNGA